MLIYFVGETDEAQRLRFQVELEFVQCLANPSYLHFLAQRNFFKDQAFVNYLKHLLYWKEPEYAKHLKYPMCLYFLDLLQHESFRKEIVNGQCAKYIDDQMILHWQHYTRKRMKILETGSQNTSGNVAVLCGGGGSVLGSPAHQLHSTPPAGNRSPAATSTTLPLNAGSHTTLAAAAPVSSSTPASSAALSNPTLNIGLSNPNLNINQSVMAGPILNSAPVPMSSISSNIMTSSTVGSISNAGVMGSPRVSSPGNISPASALNGHSQKML
ncbi:mediator of RNA polymerase II transcription subunit 31-like [Hyalella azteca]|uniref:Mediator of RNA polymerase II transcription subunit 31 n=1 Tax=Hyalella azteca TaxID=294128 RepID=A0A8B7NCE3_HYAAZ|nr:mediator of RNA polymerase II transcription subunit 31-like [Hyalella azteca]